MLHQFRPDAVPPWLVSPRDCNVKEMLETPAAYLQGCRGKPIVRAAKLSFRPRPVRLPSYRQLARIGCPKWQEAFGC